MQWIAQTPRRIRCTIACAAMLALTTCGYAQQTLRLPPPEEEQRLTHSEWLTPPSGSHSASSHEASDCDRLPPVVDSEEPVLPPKRAFKLIQKSSLSGTWLAGGGSDGLGITEASAKATTFIPLPIFGSPVLVTPSFGVTQFDSPQGGDLPSEVYRASATFLWMKKSSDRLSYMLGVSPGVSSDLEATEQAFRVFGFGSATYQWRPAIQLTFGAAYTGRNDLPVLPMAGLIWTPSEDFRVEMTAPRPRIARRLHGLPWCDAGGEDWGYVAGELGGGTWAVRQPTGRDDQLTIRDFRLLVGYERTTANGLNGRLEVGYVFGREIEFEDDPTEFAPPDTWMIRSGFSF